LDHVGTPEVQMRAWIGMLWDTLGWILFEEGKTPETEKYLRSSWLRATGEVGYHLGRACEAEGNEPEAIRMYELSLGAGWTEFRSPAAPYAITG
jgi:hypothetical protein